MSDTTAFNPALIQLPPEPHAAVITEFGLQGGHVGPSEVESPWVPFGDSAAIRHLSFDVRTGSVALQLPRDLRCRRTPMWSRPPPRRRLMSTHSTTRSRAPCRSAISE